MQHLIKCYIKHINNKSYSIYALACLYTIRGYTQYLPTGKYTNSSSEFYSLKLLDEHVDSLHTRVIISDDFRTTNKVQN